MIHSMGDLTRHFGLPVSPPFQNLALFKKEKQQENSHSLNLGLTALGEELISFSQRLNSLVCILYFFTLELFQMSVGSNLWQTFLQFSVITSYLACHSSLYPTRNNLGLAGNC